MHDNLNLMQMLSGPSLGKKLGHKPRILTTKKSGKILSDRTERSEIGKHRI
jgi:hypothetical protein